MSSEESSPKADSAALSDLIKRAAITLIAVLLFLALHFIATPGLGRAFDLVQPDSIFVLMPLSSIGIMPFIYAALVVELVVIAVPKWRTIRGEGMRGRLRLLRISMALGFVFLLVQAFVMASSLSAQHDPLFFGQDGVSSLPLIVLSLATAALVELGLALFVSREGLGNGVALALVMRSVVPMAQRLLEGPSLTLGRGELLVLAAAALAIWGALRTHRNLKEPSCGLPIPSSSDVPIGLAAAASVLPFTLVNYFNVDTPTPNFALGCGLAVGVLAIFIFERISHPLGGLVATFGGELEQAEARRNSVRKDTFMWCGALLALYFASGPLDAPLSVLGVVLLAAYGVDLYLEVRARKEHVLIAAEQLSRLAHASAYVKQLPAGDEGSPHIRGAGVRALFGLFGPLIAIDVLLPTSWKSNASAAET